MDAEPGKPGDGPAEVYTRRLRELLQEQAVEEWRERLLGFLKLAVAAITLISTFVLLRHTSSIELLPAPVGLFVVLAVVHEKVIRSLRLRARNIRFYERGLARIEDRWAGTGETGERFLDPLHPYARDLDLFGKASVFELLCTARTRAGEETLAAWLLAAAPVDEIRRRQGAITDLKDRVTFREKLFSLAETVRLGVRPEALAAWGEREPYFAERGTRVVTGVLAVLWILSLVAWGVWGLGSAALAMSVLNLGWAQMRLALWRMRRRTLRCLPEFFRCWNWSAFLLQNWLRCKPLSDATELLHLWQSGNSRGSLNISTSGATCFSGRSTCLRSGARNWHLRRSAGNGSSDRVFANG